MRHHPLTIEQIADLRTLAAGKGRRVSAADLRDALTTALDALEERDREIADAWAALGERPEDVVEVRAAGATDDEFAGVPVQLNIGAYLATLVRCGALRSMEPEPDFAEAWKNADIPGVFSR